MRIIEPNKKIIDNIPLEVQRVFHFLDENLDSKWEFYISPHCNGVKPDFLLLNPELGLQVIEFENNDNQTNLLDRLHSKVEDIYTNYLYFGDAKKKEPSRAIITSTFACPNSSENEVENKLKELEKGTKTYVDKRYLTTISSETLTNRGSIFNVVPMAKYNHSVLMTKEIANYFRIYLGVSDYFYEKNTPLKIKELDYKQQGLVIKSDQKAQKIRGAPGSGKTLVLAARAIELIKQNKSVLILVYNKTLINLISEYIERFKMGDDTYEVMINLGQSIGDITINYYQQFCKKQFVDSGYLVKWNELHTSNVGPEKQLKEISLFMLKAMKDNSNHFTKYDAVLVDEGQNFITEMWDVCNNLMVTDGSIMFALDERQDIYNRKKNLTQTNMPGRWTELKTSYRLPEKYIPFIENFGNEFLLENINIPLKRNNENQLLTGIEDCYLSWENIFDNDLEVISRCVDAVNNDFLKLIEKYAFSDVLIITGTKTQGLQAVEALEKKNIPIFHTFHKKQREGHESKMAFSLINEKVKGITSHSFIGYESPLIIYLLGKGANHNPENVYTTLTRLRMGIKTKKCYIKVICSNKKYENYSKSWAQKNGQDWLKL